MAKTIDKLDKSVQTTLDLSGYATKDHGTHVEYTAITPSANGTASVGTSGKVARADHIHPLQENVSGNAGTATKLKNTRTLTVGSTGKNFDGSANVSWTLAEIGAAASSHDHTILGSVDTRNANGLPNSYTARGITPEFKATSTIGLPNVGKNFAGVLTYQQWSDITNWSGGKTTQFATIDDGRMYYRKGDGSGWGSWYQFYTTANKPTPSDIGAAATTHGTHVTYSTTSPKVAGTAAVGSESSVARGDHVHAAQTSVTGNAGTATKLQTARNITIGNKTNSFDGSAAISFTLADIGAAASSHNHGLLHDSHAVEIADTTTDSGWSMFNSTYNGYLLKSVRFRASSPSWGVGNYGSGIVFGGADTKGVMSVAYNSPSIKIAGGNGTAPVWWVGLTGTSAKTYNLDNFAASSHGTHVPTPQTASNTKFLRNDNTWQDVTPANIGAATSGQLTTTNANIGTLSNLKTSAKGNLVAAINELFQNANNGKQLIADAIGSPLSSSDTFSAMSTSINNLLNTFKTNMTNNGVTVASGDKFKQLIDKIADVEVTRFPSWYTAEQKRMWFKLSNSLKGSEDQRAHVIGNEIYLLHGFGNTTSHESFNVTTGTWTTRANKTSSYDFSSITYNNKIYISGGATSMSNYVSYIDCYDPATNTLTRLASKYNDTYQDQMFVKDNVLYVFNGWKENGSRDNYYYTVDLSTNTYAYKYKDSSVPSTNISMYYNNYFYYVAAASDGTTNKGIYRATVSSSLVFSNIVEIMIIPSSVVGEFFIDEKGNIYMYTYTEVYLLDFTNKTYKLMATYSTAREYSYPGVAIKDNWLYVMCGSVKSGAQFSQVVHTYYLK